MRIIGARWTPQVNMLLIRCGCGTEFEHRADRWWASCRCGDRRNLAKLRDEYVQVRMRCWHSGIDE